MFMGTLKKKQYTSIYERFSYYDIREVCQFAARSLVEDSQRMIAQAIL